MTEDDLRVLRHYRDEALSKPDDPWLWMGEVGTRLMEKGLVELVQPLVVTSDGRKRAQISEAGLAAIALLGDKPDTDS